MFQLNDRIESVSGRLPSDARPQRVPDLAECQGEREHLRYALYGERFVRIAESNYPSVLHGDSDPEFP